MLSQVLKVSRSIKCTLVPGNDLYSEKKGFKWEFFVYEETKLGIRFKFDFPGYISVGDTDTMKV